MKRKERTKTLIEGDPALLERLVKQVEECHTVEIVRNPEPSLVMLKALDSVSEQPFYLGEVMVTECTVSVNGTRGLGVIAGDQGQRAYQLAVVDACWNANVPETADWEPLLRAESARVAQKQNDEFIRVAQSRVQFETMEEHYAKR